MSRFSLQYLDSEQGCVRNDVLAFGSSLLHRLSISFGCSTPMVQNIDVALQRFWRSDPVIEQVWSMAKVKLESPEANRNKAQPLVDI